MRRSYPEKQPTFEPETKESAVSLKEEEGGLEQKKELIHLRYDEQKGDWKEMRVGRQGMAP